MSTCIMPSPWHLMELRHLCREWTTGKGTQRMDHGERNTEDAQVHVGGCGARSRSVTSSIARAEFSAEETRWGMREMGPRFSSAADLQQNISPEVQNPTRAHSENEEEMLEKQIRWGKRHPAK
ncbi:uncharacterized protein [Patagioenas fasciata]|uniref:uncharacterized protein n=1 Tax=Patagioenas fasciata TaxID=372321 RepID=UPI003A9A19EF